MPRSHIVQQGECLTSIAAQYGFADYKKIYDYAANEAFRKKRPNPHLLQPGDEIVIPEKEQKVVLTLETGKSYRIVVRRPKRKLALRILDDNDEPLKKVPFRLKAGDDEIPGQTTDSGLIETKISADLETVEVEILGSVRTLKVGHLDPLKDADQDGITGVQARLANLGYDPGPIDGSFGPPTEAAIMTFQQDYDLKVTGKIDKDLRDALEKLYGC